IQADAFRDLRTRLLALGGDRNFVTLVAPVVAGCGGSFVARNLAAAFAFDETKVATLVDCDALHPAQHSALGVDASDGGLMDYIEGGVGELRTCTTAPACRACTCCLRAACARSPGSRS